MFYAKLIRGCGVSQGPYEVRDVCGSVVCGVDHSEVMLGQARRRNAEAIRAGRVDLRPGTAGRLPSFDAVFDKVLAVNSMGFWEDQVACLRSIRSLLQPGGRIAGLESGCYSVSPAARQWRRCRARRSRG
jgi:SAM-dependent methyltransferase